MEVDPRDGAEAGQRHAQSDSKTHRYILYLLEAQILIFREAVGVPLRSVCEVDTNPADTSGHAGVSGDLVDNVQRCLAELNRDHAEEQRGGQLGK